MRSAHFAAKPPTPLLWSGIAVVLLGLSPAIGRASVILGNIPGSFGGNSNVSIDTNHYFAASFTMGSTAFSLSDVKVVLNSNPSAGTNFVLESNTAGHPSGSTLVTFNNHTPSFVGAPNNTTYTFTSTINPNFMLNANTTYWLVGNTSGPGASAWVNTNPQTNPSGSGATFGSYASSGNAGVTWAPTTANSPIFQVDGTATSVGTPEPSSLVLVGTVACAGAAVGWRRRRTRRRELAVVTALPGVTAQSADGT